MRENIMYRNLVYRIITIYLSIFPSSCEINFNYPEERNIFTSVPTTVKTFENDSVLLPCLQATPARFVRWHRDDVLLVDSRQRGSHISERIHLLENGSLMVDNVQPEDTGDYYCEVMTNNGHAVQVHAIEVQYPPSIISQPSGVLELPIGAIFEVTCEVKGYPNPVVTWRHNGILLDEYHVANRQSHLINIKSRSDSGIIECIATNGVGQPAVASVHLNVLFAPEVEAVHSIVYAKMNTKVHLECIVESAPIATIQWFHHGLPVTINNRIYHHESELQSNGTIAHYVTKKKHTLIIKNIRDSDMGLYECRSENTFGFNSTAIELTGRPMPCVFKISPGAPQTSTSHNLIWHTESLSPILEYKLRFRQISSGNDTSSNSPSNGVEWNELTIPAELSIGPIYTTAYTMHGLQPASIYEVMVLSRNHFGWSEKSKILRFATGGEVELPNYSMEISTENDQLAEEEEIFNEIVQSSHMNYPKGDPDRSRAPMYYTSALHLLFCIIVSKIL